MLSIFDFDQTITLSHTFNQYQLKPPIDWKPAEHLPMLPGYIYIERSGEATLNWTVVTQEGVRLEGQVPYTNASELIPGSMVPFERRLEIRSALLTGFDSPLKKALILSFSTAFYAIGKELSKTNLRPNLADFFKHDDDECLSSVATFHNNHSLVAGFIASFLEKELVFQENILSEDPVTAIAVYHIEGLAKPFLISYIPEIELAFNEKMNNQLGNLKNHQIEHLYQIMIDRELIAPDTVVEFYDDSQQNFLGAGEMTNINCYWVDTNFRQLTIKETISAELAPEYRAGPSCS